MKLKANEDRLCYIIRFSETTSMSVFHKISVDGDRNLFLAESVLGLNSHSVSVSTVRA